MADRFRFGEFEFEPGSRDLRRMDGGEAQRLAPQPAELLHMLVAADGAIVTRHEIRARLWPDTHVDFDTSLHFCVRQVRSALADSGSDPRYVQNVPRRGYRLAVSIARVEGIHLPPVEAPAPPRRLTTARWMLVPAVVLAIAAGVAAYYRTDSRERTPPIRLAITAFEPPVAEWALEQLSSLGGAGVEIIGPTTTSGYARPAGDIRSLAADYRLDYVLNGRSLSGESGPYLLAELIRVSDGAHVWVRPYADLRDRRRVGHEIARHVARALRLPVSSAVGDETRE